MPKSNQANRMAGRDVGVQPATILNTIIQDFDLSSFLIFSDFFLFFFFFPRVPICCFFFSGTCQHVGYDIFLFYLTFIFVFIYCFFFFFFFLGGGGRGGLHLTILRTIKVEGISDDCLLSTQECHVYWVLKERCSEWC